MTQKVVISRLESSDQGTFGVLETAGFKCFTGELPDRDNKANVSCIQKGQYVCTWTLSPRFKRLMYGVDSVKGRAGIRVHSANFCGDDTKGFRKQLNGCIALGEKLGQIGGQKAVLLSSPAVRQFERIMDGKPFVLEIK